MKKYLITFLAGVLAVLLVWLGFKIFWQTAPANQFNLDHAAVIRQIRTLSRLETASFTIEKVIEAGTNYDQLRQLLFGDKILLIAHGEVIAGFDLSQFSDKDISGTQDNLLLTLPAPRVLSTSLDNSQTTVFDRKLGLLTKGDINLEAQARSQAEEAITKAACDGKILDTANENGRKQLEVLFKTAGFSNVTISLSPPANCP